MDPAKIESQDVREFLDAFKPSTRKVYRSGLRTKKILVALDTDIIAFHTRNGVCIQTAIMDALSKMHSLEVAGIDYYDLRECWRVLREDGHNCPI